MGKQDKKDKIKKKNKDIISKGDKKKAEKLLQYIVKEYQPGNMPWDAGSSTSPSQMQCGGVQEKAKTVASSSAPLTLNSTEEKQKLASSNTPRATRPNEKADQSASSPSSSIPTSQTNGGKPDVTISGLPRGRPLAHAPQSGPGGNHSPTKQTNKERGDYSPSKPEEKWLLVNHQKKTCTPKRQRAEDSDSELSPTNKSDPKKNKKKSTASDKANEVQFRTEPTDTPAKKTVNNLAAAVITIIIRLVVGQGSTLPCNLDDKTITNKVEERAGKNTVKEIRKNKKEGTTSIKLESTETDEHFKKFISNIPLRQPITLAPGNTLVINPMEKKPAEKFTILASYYNDRPSAELKKKLEEENNIKIHTTKRIGKTNVHIIELKYGSKAADKITLNNRIKETRPYTSIRKCHKCNASNHTTLSCPLKNRICFKCQRDDHISKDCKNPRPLKSQTCRDCKLNHTTGDPKCKKIIELRENNKKMMEQKNKKQLMNRINKIEKQQELQEALAAETEKNMEIVQTTDNNNKVTNITQTTVDQEEIARLKEENKKLKEENQELNKKFEEMSKVLQHTIQEQAKTIAENKEKIEAMNQEGAIAEITETLEKGKKLIQEMIKITFKAKKINPSQINHYTDHIDREVSDADVESDIERFENGKYNRDSDSD